MSDGQIAAMLRTVPEATCWDPLRAAWGFRFGWVVAVQPPHPHRVIEEHLDDWIAALVDDGGFDQLKELSQRIDEALASHGQSADKATDGQ